MNEVSAKLADLRKVLVEHQASAFLFRGCDWFAWVTGGASNVVLLAAETGIAEVLVTPESAFILTDPIESERLIAEELRHTSEFTVVTSPWYETGGRDRLIRSCLKSTAHPSRILSDRPVGLETLLPAEIWALRYCLRTVEIERYRQLGRDAAVAMTEAMSKAQRYWSEEQLAGEGARALWSRGIEPALILVAGETRLLSRRHPRPTSELLQERAMMVFCARRHGLYANLTRFIGFRPWTDFEEKNSATVAAIEAIAFESSLSGENLSTIFSTIRSAYQKRGMMDETELQHFGGLTGYAARELFARPSRNQESSVVLRPGHAVAWNPTLPGTKIEDTVLITEGDLEILTVDPAWPTHMISGRPRPRIWVRT